MAIHFVNEYKTNANKRKIEREENLVYEVLCQGLSQTAVCKG